MRPKAPPKFCGHCPGQVTEWHCPNPQCLWSVCTSSTCRKITDVTGLIPRDEASP